MHNNNLIEKIVTICSHIFAYKLLMFSTEIYSILDVDFSLKDAPALIHRLLCYVAENMPCPPQMLVDVGHPGMLWNAASSLASKHF